MPDDRDPPGRRRPFGWGTVLGLLTAGVLLFIMSAPGQSPDAQGDPTTTAGGMRLMVLLERDGVQSRHDGYLEVKPGDGVHLEWTVAVAGRYVVGVLEGKSWTPLAVRWLEPGAHVIDVNLDAGNSTLRATVLAGLSSTVGKALESGDRAGLQTAELVYGQ